MVERRIKEARGSRPVKSLDSFDFRGDSFCSTRPSSWNSPVPSTRDPPRKRHRGRQQRNRQDAYRSGIGLAACQKGLSVGFYTAAALVYELPEARR